MATTLTPTTTIDDLQKYQREAEASAWDIVMAEVRLLRAIYPNERTKILADIALENPDIRKAYNQCKAKAESLGKTLRRRQRIAAADNLKY